LGAGSSVPFEIPAMTEFVQEFKKELDGKENQLILFGKIQSALDNSEKLVAYKINFDLESLMVVLQDLCPQIGRPISLPTFAFMLSQTSDKLVKEFTTRGLRARYTKEAGELLKSLRCFIFEKCIWPIKNGQKINDFSFLDKFYGPLFSVIDRRIANRENAWIFTTNWDLCLKQWLEYAQIAFDDGTWFDINKKSVLNPNTGWSEQGNSSVKVVPLHGCFDFANCTRHVAGGTYTEIQKISNPDVYLEGKPSEIAKAFIIYPLEAVGYDQTIKSPYLDMLFLLKKKFKEESAAFVIGFSFRDSIIASLFDEVVRERIEQGQKSYVRVFLIDRDPDIVVANLERQGYRNIANVATKVKISFPKIFSQNNQEITQTMQTSLNVIAEKMRSSGLSYDQENTNQYLKKYGLHLGDG
jgi:hypothetical protein